MKNKNLLKFITISFFVIFIFSVPIITLFTEDKKISEIENNNSTS
jgi:nucleoside recognition membrane protein YjiH